MNLYLGVFCQSLLLADKFFICMQKYCIFPISQNFILPSAIAMRVIFIGKSPTGLDYFPIFAPK